MSLSSFAVNAPVKVSMIFLGVLLLGWISLSRLPTNLFPDIRAPKVTVTVTTNGLSPGEVERRINEVIERSLYSIRGVLDVQSIARADTAVIVVNFTWDSNLDYAFLEVKKAASDLERDRSDEIESISVLRYDPNAMPVVTAALRAPESIDLEDVYKTAERTLKPRFERLEGVANVVVTGGLEREIRIDLDEPLLLAYDLNVSTVVSAIQNDNSDATGGWVEEGPRRYLLKAAGEFRNIDDVRRVVVTRRGNSPILLGDVANVYFAPREPKSLVYLDGEAAVALAFYRSPESNTVAVAEAIRAEIENSARVLPDTWQMTVANDQSTFISAAIREVRNNAIIGGVLAIVVILLFLRDIISTLIVAIAIPISIVATFNLMYFQGLSLNLMTLGGLALGTGMLVDNAIVVLENIYRLLQTGRDRREAARLGVREVGGALVASTLTTVAVFLPIVFVRGVAGLLFQEQALTVAYSLLGSLVVALLLIPMLCAFFLNRRGTMISPGESFDVPRNPYTMILRLALRLRLLVVLAAAGSLYLVYVFVRDIPQEFLPATESDQVAVRVVLPNGTPIEATDDLVQSINGQLRRFEPALESVLSRVGEPEGVVNPNTQDPDGPNTADIFVRLFSGDEPTTAIIEQGLVGFSSSDLIAGLKPILDRVPDAKVEFRSNEGTLMDLVGSARAPLILEISGPELTTLKGLAEEAQRRLSSLPELRNVRTNILEGAPEVMIRLDKAQLSRLGLDVSGVGGILRQRIEGEVASQITQEAGDVDLRVQVDYGRESLDTLRNILIKSSTGALIRLEAVAEFEIVRAPREIVRRGQERVAFVLADLAPGLRLSEGIAAAQASVDDLPLPPRYLLRFTGEEEQRRDAFGDLAFALLLSIALVYMVMASIFESFIQPLLIMLTIPLAGLGVVAALLSTGQTFNVMSIIGIVMLGGIVVNNAIVLLDCVNQVRSSAREAGVGIDPTDSLVLGCNRRFRPVLMTTTTTVFGLLPMAIGFGDGAELRQAMAITVLGGLISSTVLTLVIIPVCQSYLDSATQLLGRLFRTAVSAAPPEPSLAPAKR